MSMFHSNWGSRVVHLGIVLLICVCVTAPRESIAHGETDIQIREKTRQIETATNNPAHLYLLRAELHCEHRDWESAAADYDRAAELDPELPNIGFYQARMLFNAGKIEESLKAYNKVLEKNPRHGEAIFGRARIFSRMGKVEEGLAEFQRALELLDHPQPDHFLEVAQTFLSHNKASEALRILDKGVGRFGPVVTLQSPAVEIEVNREEYDSALRRLDTIIKQSQRRESWLALRGKILIKANRPTEAREAFQQSLAAIGTLPSRLQQGPPMAKLRSDVESTLMGLVNTPEAK